MTAVVVAAIVGRGATIHVFVLNRFGTGHLV